MLDSVLWGSFRGAYEIRILKRSLWLNYSRDVNNSWSIITSDIFPKINMLQVPCRVRIKTTLIAGRTNLNKLVRTKNIVRIFCKSRGSNPMHECKTKNAVTPCRPSESSAVLNNLLP